MSRRSTIDYAARLHCAHSGTGYCLDCYRAALARGLSAAEWADLHRQAAAGNKGYRPKPTPSSKGFRPAIAWNGSAIDDITAAIVASTAEGDRHKCAAILGSGAHGYTILAVDGCRFLAHKWTPKTEDRRCGAYLDLEPYAWVDLPLGIDVAIRRVILLAETGTAKYKRDPLINVAYDGADLILHAYDRQLGEATERISVRPGRPAAATVDLNASWLLEVARGGLQLGIAADRIMLRPAADQWRYVQMGYRR
jgi:hypothetical protein